MTIDDQIALARADYEVAFDDAVLGMHVTSIIEEVIDGKHPDDTDLLMYATVGEVRAISGFWLDEFIVSELVQTMQGRAWRACCVRHGLDLDDTATRVKAAEFMMTTETQTMRVTGVGRILFLLMFGSPNIDTEKIDALKRKHQQMMEHIASLSGVKFH